MWNFKIMQDTEQHSTRIEVNHEWEGKNAKQILSFWFYLFVDVWFRWNEKCLIYAYILACSESARKSRSFQLYLCVSVRLWLIFARITCYEQSVPNSLELKKLIFFLSSENLWTQMEQKFNYSHLRDVVNAPSRFFFVIQHTKKLHRDLRIYGIVIEFRVVNWFLLLSKISYWPARRWLSKFSGTFSD